MSLFPFPKKQTMLERLMMSVQVCLHIRVLVVGVSVGLACVVCDRNVCG